MASTEIRGEILFFFFQAEDGIRDYKVTGVQTCALPICGVRFTLDNLDGTAPVLRIVKLTGDGQTATVGAAYAAPVRVKVTDAKGAAVEIGRASCRERV